MVSKNVPLRMRISNWTEQRQSTMVVLYPALMPILPVVAEDRVVSHAICDAQVGRTLPSANEGGSLQPGHSASCARWDYRGLHGERECPRSTRRFQQAVETE